MASKTLCVTWALILLHVGARAQTDLLNLEFCNPATPEYVRAYKKAGILDAYALIAALRPPMSTVQVGVVDSPVDKSHLEFVGVKLESTGVSSILSRLLPHGTSVAGIIGANNIRLEHSCTGTDRLQMNGVLSGAGAPYKLLAVGQILFLTEDGARALDALGKASIPVVNLSRGLQDKVDFVGNGFTRATQLFRTAIGNHPETLYVVAAGEFDGNVSSVVPANLGGPNGLGNVLTVAGTAPLDDRRSAIPKPSNWGAAIDIAAPAEDVYAPTVLLSNVSSAYVKFSGTSAAAPLVAGTAALLKALSPGLKVRDLKRIILESADDISALEDSGKPIGGKRLNTCRAVLKLLGPPMPQLLSPANNAVICLNLSTPSGSAYAVPLSWSDVSPQACNAGLTYQLAVNNNGQQFTGGSFSTTSFILTVPSPLPAGFGLTGWTWTVTAVDPFANQTQSGTGVFSLQPPVAIPQSDLTVSKTAGQSSIVAGGDISYTVVVTNNGPSTATGVTLNDPTPANTTFQSITVPAGWACTTPQLGGTGTISCTSPNLAANASSTFSYTIATSAAAVPMISNTATVSADNEPAANTGNNQSSQQTTIVALAKWTRKSPMTQPSARIFHALAFDSASRNVVLFGGGNVTGLLNDTWSWDGTNWTQVAPTVSPSPREGPAMAYDKARNELVLFGGAGFFFSAVGDTWIWDGTNWTQRFPASSPSPRAFHSMVFDEARGQILMFGGCSDGAATPLQDTWIWDGTTWTQVSSINAPSARCNHAMAYDGARNEVVLFGAAGSIPSNDTWIWDGTNWSQKTPASSPPPRFLHSMTYDATRGQIVLFGGEDGRVFFGDTWAWDGVTWTELFPATSPPVTTEGAMTFDSSRGQVVLFGGLTGFPERGLNDTWVWPVP